MAVRTIVSYDDSANDRDALTLGALFTEAGATLSLAYVRHTEPSQRDREEHEAQALLARGAESIGLPDAPRHVIVHASTAEGLWGLAEREADLVVFGSDYHTAPGSVSPGTSAQRLLTGGPAAVAVAPAEFRNRSAVQVARIGVINEGTDHAPAETATTLADALGASVVEASNGSVDLLVIGSRPEATQGQLTLSAVAEYALDIATCPVLALPRGVPLRFEARTLSSA